MNTVLQQVHTNGRDGTEKRVVPNGLRNGSNLGAPPLVGDPGTRLMDHLFDEEAPPRLNQLTLIVGWGGTGHVIATQIKARFVESYGQAPENVAILCFDSAEDPVTWTENRTGSVVALEKGKEFIRLAPVPLHGIRRYPERHPAIVERVSLDVLNQINRSVIVDGAAQDRIQGLLVYLWNARTVEEAVVEAARRLSERNRDLRQEVDVVTTLKIFFVGSIAGGQGCGALIDAGCVMRQKLSELGSLAQSSSVIGVLVLPGAFREKENSRMRANAQSFVEEVNSLMLGTYRFRTRYLHGAEVDLLNPPFDYVYVFDGVDEQGKHLRNREEVCSLAAQTIWALASNPVGMHQINTMLNKMDVLGDVSDGGFGTYVGTAGQAIIRYPAREIVERCSVEQARAVVAQLVAGVQADAQPAVGPAVGLATAAGLSALRKQLHTTEEGAPFQVNLTAPAALEQLPVEETPARTRNLVENYLRRRLYDECFVQMKTQAEAQKISHGRVQEEQLQDLLQNGRLAVAVAWLRQSLAALERQIGGVVGAQERYAELVETQQVALKSAGEALDRAGEGFIPFLRRTQMRSAVQVYLDEANALARLLLEQRGEELTYEVLRSVAGWLQQQVRLLESGVARLQQAGEWLGAYGAEMAQRTVGGAEISLAEPGLIEHFYHTYGGNVAAETHLALVQGAGLLGWVQQTPEAIARHLMQNAAERFAPVLKLTVEDVLALRWNERSAQHWVELLKSLAAVAWNVDPALLRSGGADLATFVTIGVPDAARSIFANCGHTLVSTHDAERIIVLRTVYGASFDVLRPFDLWKQAYARLAARRALHTLPNFRQDHEYSDQVFALGLVFGLIVNERAWYSYRPVDKLREPVRLGQGREQVLAAFAQQRGLQQEVLARVETQIAAEGNERARGRIGEWIERHGVGGDETMVKLCRAARAYLGKFTSPPGPLS